VNQSNSTQNTHDLGDQWNGEDLSIYSLDDRPLPLSHLPPTPSNQSSVNLAEASSPSLKGGYSDETTIHPTNLKASLKTPSIVSEGPSSGAPEDPALTATPGYRAAEAYVRPSPMYTIGKIVSYGFDLRYCIFTLRLQSSTAATDSIATEIFLPEVHFPRDRCEVVVSGGKWSISDEDGGNGCTIQVLRWWHREGEQNIKVTGVRSASQAILAGEDEAGYLDQCQQSKCSVM
jgi:hypothetical protein